MKRPKPIHHCDTPPGARGGDARPLQLTKIDCFYWRLFALDDGSVDGDAEVRLDEAIKYEVERFLMDNSCVPVQESYEFYRIEHEQWIDMLKTMVDGSREELGRSLACRK